MGSKSRGGGVQTASQGVKTAPQQYSYGGMNMSQAEAQQKHQTDLANWRAPVATGTGAATGVPTVGANPGYDGGPPLPGMGVLPTAPVVVPRQQLAQIIRRPQYVGGRGGDRSSSGYGYSGGGPGGSHGFGGSTGSATGGAGRGSSARSGGLY
jgi:hypothetical protein